MRFYRLFIGEDIAGRSLDLKNAFQNIDKLPWDRENEAGRYYKSGDGDVYSAWPYLVDNRMRITVGRDLVDANPTYEQKGRLDFAQIDPGSRWVGLTYCVLFDKAIVGVINSQQGPNTIQVALYLQNKGLIPGPLSLRQLSRTDIVAQLKRLSYVSRYAITIHPGSLFFPRADELGGNSLGEVLSTASKLQDAKIIRLSVESENKRTPLSGFLDFARSIVQSGRLDTAWAQQFEIDGPDKATGNLCPINLLKDYLCATKIVPLRKKALDEEVAFHAIESAYAENLHEFPSIDVRKTKNHE